MADLFPFPSPYTGPPEPSLTDKCIVFDLDQTFVNTFEDYECLRRLDLFTNPKTFELRKRVYKMNLEDIGERKGAGTELPQWGIMRPHLKEFLVFCSSYFNVVTVWSAGLTPYVQEIVLDIFKGIKAPRLVFSRDQCKERIKDKHTVYEKPLKDMYQLVPQMNETNTFILDDREYSFDSVNPDNGILIPPYTPPCTLDGLAIDDPTLLQLKAWLLQPEVMQAKDVRTLDKSRIFTTPLNQY